MRFRLPRFRRREEYRGHAQDRFPPRVRLASRLVVRLISRTPSRSSSRVTSLETAEGDTPRSSAAAAKLPRSITRWKTRISSGGLGIFKNFVHE